MHTLLLHLISCCLRSKHEEEDEEERSLLPNVDNLSASPTINYGSTLLDHQKAKERLGVILKSKKDKMVDVKYDAPFNLRNAPRSKRERGSSSRSHRSSSNNGTSDARAYPNHRHTSDSMLPTPAQSRMTSPSPKPSPNISRSHSAASLSRHSQVDEALDMYREPVLNARLVSLRGEKKKTPNRRGRPRAKFGLDPHQRRVDGLMLVNGETALGETFEGAGDVSDPNADVDASGAEDDFADGDANVSTNVEAPTSPSVGKPEFLPLDKHEREEIKTASDEITRTLREGFKIIDVGSISRGWGD